MPGTIVSVLIAAVSGIWALYKYLDNARLNREAAERQANKESRTRFLEAQRPFLQRQLELFTEVSRVVGNLVTLEPAQSAWQEMENRFWPLYWCELSFVEGDVVERAMKTFGDFLVEYVKTPDEAHKRGLRNAALGVAKALQTEIKASWQASAGP